MVHPILQNTLAAFAVVAASPVAFHAAAAQIDGQARVVAGGGWTKRTAASSGAWSIVDRDGDMFVLLSADFSTRAAPDLKLFLSPKAPDDLNGQNATDGALLIAPLAATRGAQEYPLPAGVDLADYETIIIHCEAYSKLWSIALL
jgi:hypothetical protein